MKILAKIWNNFQNFYHNFCFSSPIITQSGLPPPPWGKSWLRHWYSYKLYSMISPFTLLMLPFAKFRLSSQYWKTLTTAFSTGTSDVRRSYFVRDNTSRAVGLNSITVTLNLSTGDVHNHFTQSGVKFLPMVLSSNTRHTWVISFALEISRKLAIKSVRNVPSGYSQPYKAPLAYCSHYI